MTARGAVWLVCAVAAHFFFVSPSLALAQGSAEPRAASGQAPAATTPGAGKDAPAKGTGEQEGGKGSGQRTSRISDEGVVELDLAAYPQRPKPIVEIGPRFLGNGNIPAGWELPTGAVWTPQFIVYGTYSSAIQGVKSPVTNAWTREWSNRLDLYGNLQLSGTERLLVGIRPLDGEMGASGYNFSRGVTDRWDDRVNAEVRALFFEGDFGEIFPNLDPTDRRRLDIGFAVGRQPLNFQDGILMLDDAIDLVGITRNTILPRGGSNLQITGLWGWGQINGNNNLLREHARLFSVITVADIGKSSFNAEFFYVDDQVGEDDGAYWGFSRTRRHGHLNTTLRVLGSYAINGDVPRLGVPVVDTGHLIFGEFSWTPPWGHDLVYINGFGAIDNFTSVARAPGTGGPLGRAGILFAATGFGRYPAPLSNRADDTVGGAIGYQKFLNDFGRKQFILEFAVRASDARTQETAGALGARYQQAFGRHLVIQFDGYGKFTRYDGGGAALRIESRVEF